MNEDEEITFLEKLVMDDLDSVDTDSKLKIIRYLEKARQQQTIFVPGAYPTDHISYRSLETGEPKIDLTKITC